MYTDGKFEFRVLLCGITVVPASEYTGESNGKTVLYALKIPMAPEPSMLCCFPEFSYENVNFHNIMALLAGKVDMAGIRYYERDSHDSMELSTRCEVSYVIAPVYDRIEYRLPVYANGEFYYKVDTLREDIYPLFTVAAMGTVTGVFAPSPYGVPMVSGLNITNLTRFRCDSFFTNGCGPCYVDSLVPCEEADWIDEKKITVTKYRWFMMMLNAHWSHCSIEHEVWKSRATEYLNHYHSFGSPWPAGVRKYVDCHPDGDNCGECLHDKHQLHHTHAAKTKYEEIGFFVSTKHD